MVRCTRVLVATGAGVALVTLGSLGLSSFAAGGPQRSIGSSAQQVCPNPLLPLLCPPAPTPTTAAKSPPTTKAAPTPTTAAKSVTPAAGSATTKAPAAGAPVGAPSSATVSRTATQGATGTGTVGAGGASVPLAPLTADQALAPQDAAAPQLAGTPTVDSAPTTPATPTAPQVAARDSAIAPRVPTAGGLSDHHAKLRILLSLMTVVIGLVAAAQLPASRRRLAQGG
jgi:hypothetical protein